MIVIEGLKQEETLIGGLSFAVSLGQADLVHTYRGGYKLEGAKQPNGVLGLICSRLYLE